MQPSQKEFVSETREKQSQKYLVSESWDAPNQRHGQWCVQVNSVLAFYSHNLNSNPAEAYSFSVFEKNENKQKEAGVGPLKNNNKRHKMISVEYI